MSWLRSSQVCYIKSISHKAVEDMKVSLVHTNVLDEFSGMTRDTLTHTGKSGLWRKPLTGICRVRQSPCTVTALLWICCTSTSRKRNFSNDFFDPCISCWAWQMLMMISSYSLPCTHSLWILVDSWTGVLSIVLSGAIQILLSYF